MRILHTADIHLRNEGDSRWNALETIIQVARDENVDLLIISGDLFDSGVDAESLRPKIRKVFSGSQFHTIILPGNHDIDSYRKGLYFGDNVTILSDYTPVEKYKGIRIIGVPFERLSSIELLGRLRSFKDIFDKRKKNILLYHGELLDLFFSREDFGDVGKERYMPLKLSYLEQLNIDYVLAGHFHANFLVNRLENGGYFVYPGSPISITKKETGVRKVNIFNVGKPPEEYPLDTPHYEKVIITLDPTLDEHPLETVKRKMSNIQHQAVVLLTIDGAINGEKLNLTEEGFKARLKEIMSDVNIVDENFNFRDIQHIIEDELFKAFEERLTSYTEDQRRELRDIAIRAMLMD